MKLKLALAAGSAMTAGVLAYFGLRETEASLRKKVVRAAASQMGNHDPTPYWVNATGAPQAASLSWCGVFALWCLHQAKLALFKSWEMGKGFLLTQPMALPVTHQPKPGDIAYFANYQHEAVIADVFPDGTMALINGNGDNRSVSPSRTPIAHATAIYSIQPFIQQKLGFAA